MDGHILLGAWLEQPLNLTDVRHDAAMGENIYWNLAGHVGNDRADYNVIRAGGMHVSAPGTTPNSGDETVAYDGSDESDMNFGAGSSGWLNNDTYSESACVPSGSQCGYTAANFYYTGQPPSDGSPGYPINGTPIHQGYGKGVLFWDSARQAAAFLNYSDILSADSYWLTDGDLRQPSQGGCALLPNDPTACGNGSGSGLTVAQSALPANYAWDVQRLEHLQALNGASKPVVVDVETGCPFGSGDNAGRCATPPESVAAAWHALIAGARGIIWFQHNFSGPCVDDRTFIDGSNPSSGSYNCEQVPGVTLHDMVEAITAFDGAVASLNAVLLSPTVEGYVSATGDVSTMAKAYGGSCYLFAGSGQPGIPPPADLSVTFTLADGFTGPVTVVDENRTLQATDGSFQDTFANADAVHVYSFRGGSTCSESAQPASVSVSPTSFRAASHGPSIKAGPAGTTISYTDTSPAATAITFSVDRIKTDVRVGNRCVSPARRRRKYLQHCLRLVPVRGRFGYLAQPGVNRLHFSGWIGGHRLAAGSYRLEASSFATGVSVCNLAILKAA
jgi:hypothetical protein